MDYQKDEQLYTTLNSVLLKYGCQMVDSGEARMPEEQKRMDDDNRRLLERLEKLLLN